jgi:hypothetical protein
VETTHQGAMRLDEVQGDIDASQASIISVLKAFKVPLNHDIPFNGHEFQIDADFAQILLNELVHGQRQHLPRTRGRNEHTAFDSLGFAIVPCLA